MQISLSESTIRETEHEFGMNLITWEFVDQGIGSMVARLTTETGDYYAKYYPSGHSEEKIQDEIALVSSLQGVVPVARPVATKDGKPYYHVAKDRKQHIVTASPALTGGHPEVYNEGIIRSLACMQAKMHSLDIQGHRSAPLDVARDYSFDSSPGASDTGKVDLAGSSILDDVSRVWSRLPSGLTHLDIFRGNIMANGDIVTGIIDFEDASYAPYAFCLAGTLWDLATSTADKSTADNLRVQYLDAYQGIRRLHDIELTKLDQLVFLRGWISVHGALLTGQQEEVERQLRSLEKLAVHAP